MKRLKDSTGLTPATHLTDSTDSTDLVDAKDVNHTRHIYVYSPSGAVRDRAAFRRGIARLKALGHEVEVDVDALSSYQRFAGDDATRLQAVERAVSSGADVVLMTRGGYGLTRLLPQLPYKKMAKAIDKGTEFIGLSDFTVLQCALYAKTGAHTWAGPTLLADFGVESEPDDIMQDCFQDFVLEHGEGCGWVLPRRRVRKTSAENAQSQPCVKPPDLPQNQYVARARLWGGNLTMLTHMLATPYWPDIQGGILFLEDVGEHPYRIERLLTQLLHAGILARQKAIVLGQFSDYKLTAHDKGFKLDTVVQWLRTQIKVPVWTGFPMGHVPTKVVVPFGMNVSLDVQEGQALLYWGGNHHHG